MPNSSVTLTQDTASSTGQPVRWNYGYCLITGDRFNYVTMQNTASNPTTDHLPGAGNSLDWTRIGGWILGADDHDGCILLNINGERVYNSEFDDLTAFHFHRGTDGVIGSGFEMTSQGPDQGVDAFWLYFPTAVPIQKLSRLAYYMLKNKYPSLYNIYSGADTSGSSAQENGNNWADLQPIGLWRTRRCRIFDANGNQTGFAFTVNPAWHWVDQMLVRKIKPDYALSMSGPDPLTASEAACFDFESIVESATYFDTLILQSDGSQRRRFEHHNSYTSATSLVDVLSTIQRCCRSSLQQGLGNKLQLVCDKPRASVFTFDRTHIINGSYEFSDKSITASPNRIRAKFRSLLVPAFGTIESITFADHSNPVVTCYSATPCVALDYVWIGGTKTTYDREWQLLNPQPDGLALDANGNPLQFVLKALGSNFPANWQDSAQPVQGLALAGMSQSRFKERMVYVDHKANQYARGVTAVGVPRQRVVIPQDIDYGTATFDQVSRLAKYELIKTLGPDTYSNGAFQSKYVTPKIGTLTVPLFAQDRTGALVPALQPTDHVTIDSTLNVPYAGDFEINEPMRLRPYTAKPAGSAMAVTPSGGTAILPLTEYIPAAFVDESNLLEAGWQDVPDSDPDSGSIFTGVPLADGGQLAFISGGMQSGGVVQLPSGFPASQWMGVTSPQGYIEYGHPLHTIKTEQINANLQVTLNYQDGEGNIWPGDSSYFVCAWISESSTVYSTASPGPGSINPQFLEATLAGSGAEQILIATLQNYGAGPTAPAGTPSTIALPAGWEFAKCIAVAFPYTNGGAVPSATCHTMSCTVDSEGNCTFVYSEPSTPNYAYGPVQVFLLAYKNNGGTVTDVTTAGVRWVTIPVGTTDAPLNFRFGVAVLSDQSSSNPAPDKPTVLTLPSGVVGTTIQAIASPFSFQDDGQDCHGVRALYLDQSLGMNASVEDGEGHIAYGDGTVLSVLCE